MILSVGMIVDLQDMMLFCDVCDKGYYMICYELVIEDKL